jgi:hypothetical protein
MVREDLRLEVRERDAHRVDHILVAVDDRIADRIQGAGRAVARKRRGAIGQLVGLAGLAHLAVHHGDDEPPPDEDHRLAMQQVARLGVPARALEHQERDVVAVALELRPLARVDGILDGQ